MPASHSAKPASRRTRVPPAITRGAEPMAALEVLDEVRGPLGVVLWKCVRNVNAWASTPPSRRGGLFAGSAAGARAAELAGLQLDTELVAPFSVLQRMLESPAAMDTARLVNACRRVALWAEQRGYLGTALEFMQAAAQSAPHSAALAYSVGRVARRRAEYDRAESWYARAIVQARRNRDARIYARSYSGVGNLFFQRGNFPAAKRAYMRCLRAARRAHLSDLQGSAYHDLFITELETGVGPDTEQLAQNSLEAYDSNTSGVVRLAFDVAYYWILQGRFSEALRVATVLLHHLPGAPEQALVLSMVARAAGGAGDRAAFNRALDQMEDILASGAAEDSAPRALLGIAYGAASLSDWSMAEEYGERALRSATERREGKIIAATETVLHSIRQRSELEARADRDVFTPLPDLFVAALTRTSQAAGAA